MTAGPAEGILPAGDGAALPRVRARPGARRAGVSGVWNACNGGELRPLVALTAELFGLRPSAVELVRGHSARSKLVRLELDAAAVRRRVAEPVG